MRPDKEGLLQPSYEEVAEAARGVGLEAYCLPVVPGSTSLDQARQLKDLPPSKLARFSPIAPPACAVSLPPTWASGPDRP